MRSDSSRLGAHRGQPVDDELRTCSVIVPVRDDAVELRGLLACLAAQSTPPLEIVVVDNGSRDDGAAIALAAGCIVVHEPVPGIAAAAARGYDTARGDLIVRCDADSRPPGDWIAAHLAAHRTARPGTVAVTGPGWFTLPPPFGVLASVVYVGGYMAATGAALGHAPLFGTTMSMRRTWWQRVAPDVSRAADVHDDMDLSFRLAPNEHIRFAVSTGVGMSPRALRWGHLARTRWRRAVVTLERAWREEKPWERWHRRLRRGKHDRARA